MMQVLSQEHTVTDESNAKKLMVRNGEIALSNVSFSYEKKGTTKTLFDDLNLRIPSGQSVGLIGPSGGGKTTITKLLLRFMDIDGGSITIDGQDIASITQASLRDAITYVPQEPLLFHRSLKENIAYGKPTASMEEIIEAAKKAHAHEFIDDLPHKYDTLVGERGIKLSGGQRQRVALARAILKNAPIIVLDEATSALDSESEVLIQEALRKLMENRTTIVIAHRLSTIKHLDRILVLEKGKITEDGTHDELSTVKNGTYARLWAHQSGGFIE
jgi:ATP-binding cassette subfamily B protein